MGFPLSSCFFHVILAHKRRSLCAPGVRLAARKSIRMSRFTGFMAVKALTLCWSMLGDVGLSGGTWVRSGTTAHVIEC